MPNALALLVRLLCIACYVAGSPSGPSPHICRFWHRRWEKARGVGWGSKFVEFVHVPKTAGTTVETWLHCSWNGPNATGRGIKCGGANPHITDCRHYYGGHTPMMNRPAARQAGVASMMATMGRSPLSRLVSEYNGMLRDLSTPKMCNSSRSALISMCGGRGEFFCAAGTGWNRHGSRANTPGRSPCVAAQTLEVFARGRGTKGMRYENLQSHVVMPRRPAPGRNRSAAEEDLLSGLAAAPDAPADAAASAGRNRSELVHRLRMSYTVVGMLGGADSVTSFTDRLAYVLNPPYRCEPRAARDRSARQREAGAPELLSAESIPPDVAARILARNGGDVELHAALEALDREQRDCFARLGGGST